MFVKTTRLHHAIPANLTLFTRRIYKLKIRFCNRNHEIYNIEKHGRVLCRNDFKSKIRNHLFFHVDMMHYQKFTYLLCSYGEQSILVTANEKTSIEQSGTT